MRFTHRCQLEHSLDGRARGSHTRATWKVRSWASSSRSPSKAPAPRALPTRSRLLRSSVRGRVDHEHVIPQRSCKPDRRCVQGAVDGSACPSLPIPGALLTGRGASRSSCRQDAGASCRVCRVPTNLRAPPGPHRPGTRLVRLRARRLHRDDVPHGRTRPVRVAVGRRAPALRRRCRGEKSVLRSAAAPRIRAPAPFPRLALGEAASEGCSSIVARRVDGAVTRGPIGDGARDGDPSKMCALDPHDGSRRSADAAMPAST